MELSLSREEAAALKQALDIYLKEFEFEVARTERAEYVHSLQRTFDLLQTVRERLDRDFTSPGLRSDTSSVLPGV